MATLVGIDEAGRGPVIGPIVICGVLIDEKDNERLLNIGVKDSKLLSPLKRERLIDGIQMIIKDFKCLVVQPLEIDAAVESDTINLNWLEAMKSAEIINTLKPETAIVDCPSPNTGAYASFLMERLADKKTKIVAEHKADANYPSVAAASIIAKVTRDAEIEKLKKHVGCDFGSGYPADERTVRFLKENWQKHPELFRKRWAPYKKLVEDARPKQQKLMRY